MTVTRRREWTGNGAKRLGVIAPPRFGPPPISGAVGWYDFSDVATLTLSGQLISAIADKSGNGNNGTGQSGVYRGVDPDTGRHVGVFGLSSQVDLAVSASDRTSTAFFVAMLKTLSQTAALMGPGSDGANEFRVNTSGNLETLRADIAGLATQGNAAVTAGVPFVACQLVTATDITHYLNTTSETDANATGFTAGQVLRLGRAPTVGAGGGDPWGGWIGEVLLYDTSLSGADALATVNYLRSKWGIS